MEKSKKNPARKKIALELLHQRLGHRSTISLIAGDTANVWEDVELRIYPDPFCTSFILDILTVTNKLTTKPNKPTEYTNNNSNEYSDDESNGAK